MHVPEIPRPVEVEKPLDGPSSPAEDIPPTHGSAGGVQEAGPSSSPVTPMSLLARGYIFSRHIAENIVAPAINNFLKLCNTNPKVAAVVATPLLIGCLLTITFVLICSFLLISWTIVHICFGVAVLVVSSLISLVFKLLFVIVCTLPMAAIGICLLIGANYAAERIVQANAQVEAMMSSTDTDRLRNDAAAVRDSASAMFQNCKPFFDRFVSMWIAVAKSLWSAFIAKVDSFNNNLSVLAEEPQVPPHLVMQPREESLAGSSYLDGSVVFEEDIHVGERIDVMDTPTVIVDEHGVEGRSSASKWLSEAPDLVKRPVRREDGDD